MLFTFTDGMVPSMERQMANAADLNRWDYPDDRQMSYRTQSPWRIALIVLGFIVWWPVGLALLFFTLGSRKMGCWDNGDRFANKMERMRGRMERRGFNFGGFGPPSSGNRAFDEYRVETLRRLEEEQHEFKDFLDRLRHAKDKEEFDQFMAQHKQKPTPPADQPQN